MNRHALEQPTAPAGIALLVLLSFGRMSLHAQHQIRLTVDRGQSTGPVNQGIYGVNLEYNAATANGGLWGEMIRNRGFAEVSQRGFNRERECIVPLTLRNTCPNRIPGGEVG